MPTTPQLRVNSFTTASQLCKFQAQIGNDAVVHGKYDKKTKEIILYVSKGKGTGVSNFLWKTSRRRNTWAHAAFSVIATTSGSEILKEKVGIFEKGDLPRLKNNHGWGEDLIVGNYRQPISSAASAATASLLPEGIGFDENGIISGQVKYATHAPNGLEEFKGKDIASEIQINRSILLGDPAKKLSYDSSWKITKSKTERTMELVTGALDDFNRMNYEFIDGEGRTEEIGNNRGAEVAEALHGLTDNKNATLVLSSLLLQKTLSGMRTALANKGGHMMIDYIQVAKGKDMSIIGADGESVGLDDIKQMGSSVWKVSKEGDDFKISVTWKSYWRDKPESKNGRLPIPENTVIAIDQQFDILVDGNEARKGNVKISMPNGLNCTFSGGFDPEALGSARALIP